jgi:hypothetical protein
MTLRADDFVGVNLFLLSHIDPLFAVEIADRAFRSPQTAARMSTVLFGEYVHPSLRALLCRLVGGALELDFVPEAISVVSQSSLEVNLAGLDVIAHLPARLQVFNRSPEHPDDLAGALTAPDAICDLLMQPLMAFSDLFSAIAGDWPKMASDPQFRASAFYVTNQSSFFRARVETLIALELGVPLRLA